MTEPPAPRPLVDYGRLLDAIGIEGELMAVAAQGAPTDAPVPGCPGRDVGETIRHTGSVHRVTLHWVRHGRPPREWQRRPPDGDLVGYLRRGVSELVTELARHDPGAWADTWWPADRTHGFWRRRMAHETAVHRVDVQAAAGRPVDLVDDQFALDGIDEVLFLWFGYRLGLLGMSSSQHGVVGVRSVDRHWLALFEPGRCEARRASAADVRLADAVVSGDPMPLYLWLWGRVPDQVVMITGDQDAAAQLWALLRPATQ